MVSVVNHLKSQLTPLEVGLMSQLDESPYLKILHNEITVMDFNSLCPILFQYTLCAQHTLPGGHISPIEPESRVSMDRNDLVGATKFTYNVRYKQRYDEVTGVRIESNNDDLHEIGMSIYYSPQFAKRYTSEEMKNLLELVDKLSNLHKLLNDMTVTDEVELLMHTPTNIKLRCKKGPLSSPSSYHLHKNIYQSMLRKCEAIWNGYIS